MHATGILVTQLSYNYEEFRSSLTASVAAGCSNVEANDVLLIGHGAKRIRFIELVFLGRHSHEKAFSGCGRNNNSGAGRSRQCGGSGRAAIYEGASGLLLFTTGAAFTSASTAAAVQAASAGILWMQPAFSVSQALWWARVATMLSAARSVVRLAIAGRWQIGCSVSKAKATGLTSEATTRAWRLALIAIALASTLLV